MAPWGFKLSLADTLHCTNLQHSQGSLSPSKHNSPAESLKLHRARTHNVLNTRSCLEKRGYFCFFKTSWQIGTPSCIIPGMRFFCSFLPSLLHCLSLSEQEYWKCSPSWDTFQFTKISEDLFRRCLGIFRFRKKSCNGNNSEDCGEEEHEDFSSFARKSKGSRTSKIMHSNTKIIFVRIGVQNNPHRQLCPMQLPQQCFFLLVILHMVRYLHSFLCRLLIPQDAK